MLSKIIGFLIDLPYLSLGRVCHGSLGEQSTFATKFWIHKARPSESSDLGGLDSDELRDRGTTNGCIYAGKKCSNCSCFCEGRMR